MAYVRANPSRVATILGGITFLALTCAAPAILGAVGFNAAGPVAGSIAAAWQASMGTVAAGSFFAFLQSAAMGGAAMGMITGVGAVVGGVTIAAGLATPKETLRRLGSTINGGGVAETIIAVSQASKRTMGKLGGKINSWFRRSD